jgi:hypothetical protein
VALAAAFAALGIGMAGSSSVIQSAFMAIWTVASQTLRGIFDAIAGNDFGLAWTIALGGALVAWQQFQVHLTMMWEGLKVSLMAGMSTMVKFLISQIEVLTMAAVKAANAVPGVNIDEGSLKSMFNNARTAANFAKAATDAVAAENIRKELAKLKALQDGLEKFTDDAAEKREDALKMPDVEVPEMPDSGGMAGDTAAFTRGSFNAAIASMLGRGGENVQQKLLEVTEDMADDIAIIRDKKGLAIV